MVVLLLSLIPDALLLAFPTAIAGTTSLAVIILLLMHIATVAICVWALTGYRQGRV